MPRSTARAPSQPASISSSLALVSESAPDPSPPYQSTPPLLSRHARAASLLLPDTYSHRASGQPKPTDAPHKMQKEPTSTPDLELYHPVISAMNQDGRSHWQGEFANVASNLVGLLDALDSAILALDANA
ncbi:hypothetical protein EC988_005222 [Linderina pennispora]|nr:hypothetical protein EC988_005222 [Linderina pennispora]